MLGLQAFQQCQQGSLLGLCTRVVGLPVLVQASFVADAERVPVVALGMGADELLVACLVGVSVAGDVVVVAGEAEPRPVVGDERGDGKRLVAACG